MSAAAAAPSVDIRELLPGAQFSDSFSGMTDDATLDARQAAEMMFASSPRWAKGLMKMRDAIVAPFGLKTEKMARTVDNRVGIFPVISETPQRLVAGLNDRHQDFRVIVDVAPAGERCRVTVTTICKTHNIFGRAYLATILPFHRLIVRAMLRQVAP